MAKKVIVLVLLLSMTVSFSLMAGASDETGTASGAAVMNATGLPIVNEKVTYTMAASLAPNWGDPRNGIFWKEREEETNVVIDWITLGSSEASEKFNLMMTAGDYPDAFIGGLGGREIGPEEF